MFINYLLASYIIVEVEHSLLPMSVGGIRGCRESWKMHFCRKVFYNILQEAESRECLEEILIVTYNVIIYIIKQDIIYILLPMAGQTAGLNGPTFFVDTHGWPEGVIFIPRTTPGPLASVIYIDN